MAVLSMLTIAAGTMLSPWGNGGTAHGAPWYAETPAASSAVRRRASRVAGTERADNPAFYAKALSKAFHNAASEVLPAVVTITNSPKAAEQAEEEEAAPKGNSEQIPPEFKGTPSEDMFKNNPQLRIFFNGRPMPNMPRPGVTSFGSGVIVDPSGIVLTNNHVVAGGGKITVAFAGRAGVQGGRHQDRSEKRSGRDASEGRQQSSGGPAGRQRPDGNRRLGLALGQPFGMPGTVTAGIISAKGRSLDNAARRTFSRPTPRSTPATAAGRW